MPFDLSGRVILVTGAGRGLGRDAVGGCGGRVHGLEADVSSRDTFLRVAAQLAQWCGRIDAIVNAAMWIRYEPASDVREETFDRMFAVGLKAPMWAVQALLAHRDTSRAASLINFTSPAADQGYPNTSVYAAVKGGVWSLTRTLAVELGPRGIRVNAITPGAVPTPGARAVVDEAGYEARRRKTPLGRLGREDDIAHAAAFLLSPEADFINGAILNVDGGISVSAG